MKNKQKKVSVILDKILVEIPEITTKTRSGIILAPGKAEQPATQGKVLAMGPDAKEKAGLLIEAGDTIVFKLHAGDEIDPENPRLVVIDTFDLLAVIK